MECHGVHVSVVRWRKSFLNILPVPIADLIPVVVFTRGVRTSKFG